MYISLVFEKKCEKLTETHTVKPVLRGHLWDKDNAVF
jgi:hypothetical protein